MNAAGSSRTSVTIYHIARHGVLMIFKHNVKGKLDVVQEAPKELNLKTANPCDWCSSVLHVSDKWWERIKCSAPTACCILVPVQVSVLFCSSSGLVSPFSSENTATHCKISDVPNLCYFSLREWYCMDDRCSSPGSDRDFLFSSYHTDKFWEPSCLLPYR
jgi:hypothetical protein